MNETLDNEGFVNKASSKDLFLSIILVCAGLGVVLGLGNILSAFMAPPEFENLVPYHRFYALCKDVHKDGENVTRPAQDTNLQDVADWAARAVVRAMRFDHSNIEEHFLDIRPLFTDYGWCAFISSLDKSQYFLTMHDRLLTLSMTLQSAPVASARSGQGTGWDVQVPVTLQFGGGMAPAPVNGVLQVHVVEAGGANGNEPFTIQQWVVKPQ